MANFSATSFKQKGTKPTTQMVDPHGVSQAKSGTGAKNNKFTVSSVPPGGSPMGKKGTGGTLELGKIKSMAATKITSSAISAAK